MKMFLHSQRIQIVENVRTWIFRLTEEEKDESEEYVGGNADGVVVRVPCKLYVLYSDFLDFSHDFLHIMLLAKSFWLNYTIFLGDFISNSYFSFRDIKANPFKFKDPLKKQR